MNNTLYKRVNVIASLWLSAVASVLLLIALRTNIDTFYWISGALALILVSINAIYLLRGLGVITKISSDVGEKAPR